MITIYETASEYRFEGFGERDYAPHPRHKCPTCKSPKPEHHPAVQFEGEVEVCIDPYHLIPTNCNRSEYIQAVHDKIARLGTPK